MEYCCVMPEDIFQNKEVRAYIQRGNDNLGVIGFTEHGFAHAKRSSDTAREILTALGYPQRDCQLAAIAGYMHDIGNTVNRVAHAQSGALMAFRLLEELGMAPEEVATVVAAIGNHDEGTAQPVNPASAALILADKSDVRRNRVRGPVRHHEIHDRVNYAVTNSSLQLSEDRSVILLRLELDSAISDVMDYFEIFMQRMVLCKKAANFLKLRFHLEINGVLLVS